MIARIRLLLPTYVGMVLDDYAAISLTKVDAPDSEFTVFPPIRVRYDLPNPFDVQPQTTMEDLFSGWNGLRPEAVITGHKIIEKDHWWANCFVVDCHKTAFEQDAERSTVVLEAAELVNNVLKSLRWRGRQSYIRPIPIVEVGQHRVVQTQFLVEYLDDEYRPMPKESGYRRWGSIQFRVKSGAITPDAWKRSWDDLSEGIESPLWEQLLFDAEDSDSDDRAVVTAFTALEVFIRWHVDYQAEQRGKKDSFWKWLIERGNDYDRQPAVRELFDQVFYFVEGRSLKSDAPALWQSFQELRKARNDLVHQGRSGGLMSAADVSRHLRSVRDIIDWVLQADTESPQVKIAISLVDTELQVPEEQSPMQPGVADDFPETK